MTVTQPETEDLRVLDECIAEMVALANRVNEIKRKQDMRDASEQLFDAVAGWEVWIVMVVARTQVHDSDPYHHTAR